MPPISINKSDGIVTIKVHERLDSLNTVGHIYDILTELIYTGENNVVLDLKEIKKVSNCGIGELLIIFYRTFKEKGALLQVHGPTDRETKEKFNSLLLAGVQTANKQ